MTSYFTNSLDQAIESCGNDEVISLLKNALSSGKELVINNSETVQKLLCHKSVKVHKLSLELLAELSRKEDNRRTLTDEKILFTLLDYLKNPEDLDILNYTLRTLGNVCYDNALARNIIGENGLELVLQILNTNRFSDSPLALNATGFLLNLLSDYEDLQKTALKKHILNVYETLIARCISNYSEHDKTIFYILSLINLLTDFLEECGITFEESLCVLIIAVFIKSSENPEMCVNCLEILHSQSEKDEIKNILAKEGVCELIVKLIEEHKSQINDEESRAVLKMACDLIVIILTGDYCMNILYNNGSGSVYNSMVSWLDVDDVDILSTGILAIGNFARKDVHCIQMVENGVSKKLIDLLRRYNDKTSDIKIQHALLSTLKNLVIPQKNKEQVLQEGLIAAVYPMIQLDQHVVIFKLLGTLRMVIDGQEQAALDLITREKFLGRLVYWCYNSDHLGVRGEVPRLLSWLIKHSRSRKAYHIFIQIEGTVKCIVEMISSNHAVMQNEAFYALNLLCSAFSSCHDGDTSENINKEADLLKFYDLLIMADVGKHLNFILIRYSDKMDEQSIDNLLNFINLIINSKVIKTHLRTYNIVEDLSKLLQIEHSNDVINLIHKILKDFEKV